jgi:hypothetical protein
LDELELIAAIENVIHKHEKEQNALTSKDEFMNLQLLCLVNPKLAVVFEKNHKTLDSPQEPFVQK